MSDKLAWVFQGSVPEDGDFCLVWAATEHEAVTLGRKDMGYEDEVDYDDTDFKVSVASSQDLLNFEQATDTDALREVLTERQRQRLKWGDKHDDSHDDGSLAKTSGALALDIVDDYVEFWGVCSGQEAQEQPSQAAHCGCSSAACRD